MNFRRYNDVFFFMALLLFAFFNFDLMNALAQVLITELGISTQELADISSDTFLANIFSLILTIFWIGHLNLKKSLGFFLALEALSTFAFLFVKSTDAFLLYRISTGLLLGVAFPIAMRAVALRARTNGGFITSLYGLAAMFAGVIAQNPASFLIHWLGSNGLFMCIELWALILISALLFFKTSTWVARKTQPDQPMQLSHAIYNPSNWIMALHISFLNLPVFVLGDLWSNLFLTQTHPISEETASFITSMLFIGYILGSFATGILADKTSNRRLIMSAGTTLAFACLASILLNNYTALFPLLFFGVGAGCGSQTAGYSYAAATNHSACSAAIAILSLSSIALGAIFQRITGRILENGQIINTAHYISSSYNEIFYFLLGGMLVSLLSVFLFKSKILNMQFGSNLDLSPNNTFNKRHI